MWLADFASHECRWNWCAFLIFHSTCNIGKHDGTGSTSNVACWSDTWLRHPIGIKMKRCWLSMFVSCLTCSTALLARSSNLIFHMQSGSPVFLNLTLKYSHFCVVWPVVWGSSSLPISSPSLCFCLYTNRFAHGWSACCLRGRAYNACCLAAGGQDVCGWEVYSVHVVEIFKISSLLWEARFVMNGCAFGRHLQPTSRDYYSLHKTPEDAKDRYSWWADEQRPSDVFFCKVVRCNPSTIPCACAKN